MGGRSGKEKLCKYRQAIVNDLKGQQTSTQANAQVAHAELKKATPCSAKGDNH